MDKIKVFHDFVDKYDRNIFINYLESNKELFTVTVPEDYGDYPPRLILRFGKDPMWPNNELTLDKVKPIQDTFIKYINKSLEKIKENFNDQDVYFNNTWYSKAEKGAKTGLHSDIEIEANEDLKYSAIMYFNDFEGGELYFPNIEYTIKPLAGDIIMFPSAGLNYWHDIKPILSDRYTMPMWFTSLKDKDIFNFIK
jgi:hypothetical protein